MKKSIKLLFVLALFIASGNMDTKACTGIVLKANDGGVVYGRSMEWGAFDLNSRVAIIPHGCKFRSLTHEGNNGKVYTTKYGVVGLDMLEKDLISEL